MNPRTMRHLIAFFGLLALPMAARAAEYSETVTRIFPWKAVEGRRSLALDNVFGSIVIEGGSRDTIELTVNEHFTARTPEDLARARREVELEVRDDPSALTLVQGGSWRCPERGKDGDRRHDCPCSVDDRHYEVRFDWTLRVPSAIDLDVSSVNEGAIRITGVRGSLGVRHVNDDVTMESVAGRVDARTVNGALHVAFAAKPEDDCKFGTINGDIDLAFPHGFGADLSFETMNGEVYTDFPFTPAKLPATIERSTVGGRHRHELGRATRATIGGGGIGLACSSINGDIYIRERS